MPHNINDRWLWLGFGVFMFFAAKGIHYAITDMVRLTKIDPSPYDRKDDNKKEQPENSISLENLKLLADSPNTNIANAATSLIVERFVKHPNAAQSLAKDFISPDEETRNRANLINSFLIEWGFPSGLMAPKSRRCSLPLIPTSPPLLTSNSEMELTTEQLSRRLGDGDGQGAEWAAGVLIPSPLNPVAGWTNVPRERPVDENDGDEVERRRRRREAMVLHEGAGRVVEGDIIRSER